MHPVKRAARGREAVVGVQGVVDVSRSPWPPRGLPVVRDARKGQLSNRPGSAGRSRRRAAARCTGGLVVALGLGLSDHEGTELLEQPALAGVVVDVPDLAVRAPVPVQDLQVSASRRTGD